MKPLLPNNAIFESVQEVNPSVTVWDTMMTGGIDLNGNDFVSKGMIYRPATAKSTFGDSFNFSTASLTQYHAHFDAHTTPGLLDASGNEVHGRIPVIHDYWGAGAPSGVTESNRVAIRVKGYVRTAGYYALVFAGKGSVQVFHKGVPLPVLTSNNVPALPVNVAFRYFAQGDQVDIFYWALNQEWGGWSIRVTANAGILDGQNQLIWSVLREEPVLSSQWMDDGTVVASETLLDLRSVIVAFREGQIPEATVDLALTTSDEPNGWRYNPSTFAATHNGTGFTLKVGQRIRISGGVNDVQSTEFTGMIDDITPGEALQLKCLGFEQRLVRTISENYPDRTSYASFGYTNRGGVTEPVWNVPAYDHWPYEHAIKDLCYRAWIEPSLLGSLSSLLRKDQSVPEAGAKLFYCKALDGSHILISRQPHYGNPDGDPTREPDDQYLATSQITQTVYQRIKDLVARIGYGFNTTATGAVRLRPTGVPVAPVPLINFTTGVEVVHPAAMGGKYAKYTGTGWNATATGIKAARIELVVGRAPSLGTVNVTVTRVEDGATFNTSVSLANTSEAFFYDRAVDGNGDNICVAPILSGQYYGTYNVSIVPSGGSGATEYYLDALRCYEADPYIPHPLFQLRTFYNTLDISPRSNAVDRLNDAIVTGKAQSTLTDSIKVRDLVEKEYIVSRAADVHSILNPSAANYTGGKITAFLSDESIAEQDLADWTALSLVTKYRKPKIDAVVRHTAIPVLELRDPIYVKDDTRNVLDGTSVMWVTGYETRYELDESPSAVTSIEATSFAAVQSYEPQQEVDLSLFNNKPVINLSISYPSLSGTGQVTNPTRDLPVAASESVDRVATTAAVASSSGLYLTIPADVWSPGSELLVKTSDSTVFKNNPYQIFYKRNAVSTRLDLPFSMADGSSAYDASVYGISAGTQVRFSYLKIRDAYSGLSPFYDPYASELNPPQLIKITFDALVSGYYRVTIVDAGGTETPVAYLTEPGVSDRDGAKHWTFMAPGKAKTFGWDGVDTLGFWNRRQTSNALAKLKGSFPEIASSRFEIGAGFYAQNDRNKKLAHISGETTGTTACYPISKYSQFYIKVECIRQSEDEVLTVRSNVGSDHPDPAVGSDLLNTNATALPSRFIYLHLHGQPNRLQTDIEDWNGSTYDPSNPGSSWTTSPDLHATFRDGKPVRVTLTAVPRLGTLFAAASPVAMKVHRVAHLNATLVDQAVVYFGEIWNTKSTTEKKRVISRRTVNDQHTLVFKDADFTTSDLIHPWVFYPSLFEDEFESGEEPIRYLDYHQLFEVPQWNPHRFAGEMRSRSTLAMLSYLFYLSVFTQDRSGRLAWSIDPTHIDKSKITGNADAMQWPEDLERHQRRVIYTRQWWDTDKLDAALAPYGVADAVKGAFFDRFESSDTDATRTLYPKNNGTTVTGSGLTSYADGYTARMKALNFMPSTYNTNRQLGDDAGTLTTFGNWTWELDSNFRWVPSITRDFHPFYVVPPMPLCSREDAQEVPYWTKFFLYAVTASDRRFQMRDEAKFDTYFTFVTSQPVANYSSYFEMSPGAVAADQYKNGKDEPTAVPEGVADFEKIDEIIRYEECRGGHSNGDYPARDLIQITGGDPYYLNPILYRYFRKNNNALHKFGCDVYAAGWFFVTFRHAYVWESASLFPVTADRLLLPAALDADLTGAVTDTPTYDPGAWTGWKDDHPSAATPASAFYESTNDCSRIHWRYDENLSGPIKAGGTCSIDNGLPLSGETFPGGGLSYTMNQNIFTNNTPPIAVGPRLPETRRLLFGLCLLNDRRTVSLNV
jgi:hypothetical protein